MTRVQRSLIGSALLVVLAMLLPLVVLVRDGWEPLRRLDTRADRELALPDGLARDVVLGLTQLGAPLLLEAVTVLAALWLWRKRRRRPAAYALVTVFGAEVLSSLLKLLVGRVRPCVDLASCPSTTSFPSGHATGAAAFWAAVAVLLLPVLGPRAWALLAVPLLVALTRVLLGVHYPSDVVGGLLVGGCWAAGWTGFFATWRDAEAGREVPLEEGLQ